MPDRDECNHTWSEFGSTCIKCDMGRSEYEIKKLNNEMVKISGCIGRPGEGSRRLGIDYEKLFHSLAMRHSAIYHALENSDHTKAIEIAKVTDEIIGNAYKKFESDYRIK